MYEDITAYLSHMQMLYVCISGTNSSSFDCCLPRAAGLVWLVDKREDYDKWPCSTKSQPDSSRSAYPVQSEHARNTYTDGPDFGTSGKSATRCVIVSFTVWSRGGLLEHFHQCSPCQQPSYWNRLYWVGWFLIRTLLSSFPSTWCCRYGSIFRPYLWVMLSLNFCPVLCLCAFLSWWWWCCGAIGRASDLQFIGREFRVLPGHHCAVALGKLLHPCTSVTNSITWYWTKGGDACGRQCKMQAWRNVMAAYLWVYDPVIWIADCQRD